jgi:excinuclease ABC subunit C
LPWNSESLKLIRRIRDEVHRFGISFHRNQRSKHAIQNELEKIEGIGKQTADTLLKEFKSVKKIRTLPLSEIEKIIGKARASIVFEALHRDEA